MSEAFEIGSSSSSTYVYIWPVLGLFIVVFVGLVGNTLVCLSIKLDPKLKNATNNYLFSLALTDLLVSILVIPFAIIKHFFNNVWIFGNFFCTLWIFLDVFLCTFSILLLCVISCERYIGIKEPLKGMEKSKSKTNLIVLFVCFISIIFSLPIWLLSHMSLDNILKNGNCTIYNANFKIYGSIFSFIIPLGIMMVMYWLTVKRLKIVLNEFKLKCQKNNMRLSFDCKTELENKLTKKLNLKITGKKKTDNFVKQKMDITSEKSSNNLLLNPIEKSLKVEQSLKINLSNTSLSRVSTFKNIAKESFKISKIKQNENKDELKTDEKYLAEPPVKKLRFKTIVNKHLLARQAINAFKLSRESSVVKNQQKAVKVLGVVLVIFLIAWGPFALINILSAICHSCSINMLIIDIFTWLGYISSAVNPLIYNAFNNNFRHAFKQILKCNSSSLKKSNFPNKKTNFKAPKKECELAVKNENSITTVIKPTKKEANVNALNKAFYEII